MNNLKSFLLGCGIMLVNVIASYFIYDYCMRHTEADSFRDAINSILYPLLITFIIIIITYEFRHRGE